MLFYELKKLYIYIYKHRYKKELKEGAWKY